MDMLRQMIKLSPFIATISIINVFLQSCISHPNVAGAQGFFTKLSKIIHLLALTMIAISLIGCSTVPHGKLHPDTNISNTTIGRAYDDVFNKYHIVHEWGMHLRRMRSERLELGIEYTNSDDKDNAIWLEYDILYRPVNLNRSMPYAGPFFSRLDFKFHEAVGKGAKLEKNFWIAGLLKQLLRNNRPALMLLSRENLMAVRMPPRFVRVTFMKVSYVPREDVSKNKGLWTRTILNKDYMPPLGINSQELADILKKLKIPGKKETDAFPQLVEFLKSTRLFFEAVDGHFLVNGVLVAAFMIMFRARRHY